MTYQEFVLKLLLSISLGFLIGVERQLTGHSTGIRINVLICMGATLFISFPMMYSSQEVYRIASYIVSGVGFLCSSVIFKDTGQTKGLNTSATLWCTSAIGILSATCDWYFSMSATLILILSNLILRPLAIKIKPITDDIDKQYRVSIVCLEISELEIRSLLINTKSKNLFLNSLKSGDVIGDKVEIQADYTSYGKIKNNVLEKIAIDTLKIPSVINAEWKIIQ